VVRCGLFPWVHSCLVLVLPVLDVGGSWPWEKSSSRLLGVRGKGGPCESLAWKSHEKNDPSSPRKMFTVAR